MKNSLVFALSYLLGVLLSDKDGRVNALGKRILFDEFTVRKPFYRLFRKKNGFLRSEISPRIRQVIAGTEVINWIKKYDTPPEEYTKYIESTRSLTGSTLLLIEIREYHGIIDDLIFSISSIVGLNFDVLIISDSGARIESIQEVSGKLAACGISVVALEDLDFTSYDFVVWMEASIRVRAHGPRLLIDRIRGDGNVQMAYADECFADKETYLAEAWFKPQYSPLLAEQCDLLGGMIAVRVNGLLDSFLTQDIETSLGNLPNKLVQRVPAESVLRVPHICYMYEKPRNIQACPNQKAGIDAADPSEIVSIIIPTRNGWEFLGPCVKSILQSDWPRELLEIIVVDNGSDEADLLNGIANLESGGHIKVIRDDNPFNFSRLNNLAVRESSGEILLFLNNDTVVHQQSWLHDIVSLTRRPKSGAVGAKLLYEDKSVQHSGVVLGIGGGAGHVFVGIAKDDPGYHGIANTSREISAVTGACLAVRRLAFDAAGGFDESLRVAYNDIALCLQLNQLGLQNYIVAKPLLLHYESKSRGFDTTTSKQILNLREATYVRSRFKEQISEDPYYSPNLSIDHDYHVASFPRWKSPWVVPAENSKPHVLVASSTHRIGYGVPVVVSRHVRALLEAGFEVTVAGPSSETDFTYDGASRIDFHAPAQVAEWALSNGVDVIWAHTPPYYSVARWLGGQIPVIAYDYGEPMAWLFPDWVQREKVNHDKDLAFASCDRVYAISESVETEARQKQNGIVPLGNDHLEQWNDEFNERREILRSKRGWADSRIVLNVCRFTEEERRYKGIDRFLECMRLTKTLDIAFEDQWRFVLCGRGESSDVELLTEYGLEVYPDLPDDELVDMYTAADAYANFSKWEGYNLGIGQALALGLPVVASDNPAHRAFGIDTFADTGAAAKRLIELLNAPPPRFPRCWSWERSNQSIIDITREVIGLQPLPEHKRSLRMGKDVESSASVLD